MLGVSSVRVRVKDQRLGFICLISYAIDSDAGDGSNREKFGRKDPGLSVYPKLDLASQGGQV